MMETEVKSSIEEVLPSQFQFHYDAAHGWLEVPYSAIVALHLKRQISNHSHQSGTSVYLEEGLDAPMFIRAYLKHIERPGDHDYFYQRCSTVYDGEVSQIRSYPKYESRYSRVYLEF